SFLFSLLCTQQNCAHSDSLYCHSRHLDYHSTHYLETLPLLVSPSEVDGQSVRNVRSHLASGGAALIATHIDLGLGEASILDVTPFKTPPEAFVGASDEAFL
ncbi:MAG: hypothetical protein AAGJ35_14270, partial [Myxococcota bacterium]